MSMTACRPVIAVAALSLALAACGTGKNPPDEFVVVAKPPLTVPPEFSLRPPRPGQSVKQDINTSDQALQALFPGRTELPPRPSRSEQALLKQVGPIDRSAKTQLRSLEDQVVSKGPLLPDLLALADRQDAEDGATIERLESKPQGRR